MFNWIEDFSKKVAKKKLEDKIKKLAETVEKYNFPKQSMENIGGFVLYYDNAEYFDIRIDDLIKENLFMMRRKGIYLCGMIDEKIDYTKIIDAIIEAIITNNENKNIIQKVEL